MPAVVFTTRGALSKSALRQANERLILNAIRQNPSLSRADIVRMTGLSPSSVTFIVERLKRAKMISDQEVENHSRVGRPPSALRLQADAKMAIGVDITMSGSNIALADLTGRIVRTTRVPWHPNYEIFFDKMHRAIQSVVESFSPKQVLGVGVGLPGYIERSTGKVLAAENFKWFGIEAGRLLRKRLSFPFYYENNAKLSALAETWFSKRESKRLLNFVFVTMRGGLGTGVIVNGQILQGASSAAAEFGHTILYPDGRRCACGNTGCWEQYASDLALCRAYSQQNGNDGSTHPDADAIVRLAREGDTAALRALRDTAHQVGMGFVNLIMALNPEAIVVGDYLAAGWDLVEDVVWSVLRSRVPSYYLAGVRIFPSEHAADSSLLGAIALVLSQFFTSFDHGNTAVPSNSVSIQTSA
jgi:predicted NBD/HSP70 family sugar kinase